MVGCVQKSWAFAFTAGMGLNSFGKLPPNLPTACSREELRHLGLCKAVGLAHGVLRRMLLGRLPDRLEALAFYAELLFVFALLRSAAIERRLVNHQKNAAGPQARR